MSFKELEIILLLKALVEEYVFEGDVVDPTGVVVLAGFGVVKESVELW